METKTIKYEIRAYLSGTLDDLFITQYKAKGVRWRPIGEAPRSLREAIAGGKYQIDNFRRCRKGKFFCGTVTVTSNLTPMGIYLRNKRRANGTHKKGKNQKAARSRKG